MATRREIEAGRAFVRLFLKDDFKSQLSRTLNAAGKELQSFGKTTMVVGAGLMAGGTAILAPLTLAIRSFASQGNVLDKTSKRVGISAGALSELGFALEQSSDKFNSSEEAIAGLEIGIRRMQKTVSDVALGLSTDMTRFEAAFKAMRISLADLAGKSPEEQLNTILAGIERIEDATYRAGVAKMWFGRSGTMMLPMLENLAALRQEARDLRIVPAQQEVENAAKVTDAINRVRRIVKKMIFDVGAALAEPALKFLHAVKRIALGVGTFVKNNAILINAALMAGAVLLGVGVAVTSLGFAIWGLGMSLSALATVVAAVCSPVGLLVAAVVAGTVAWLKFRKSGQMTAALIKATVLPVFDTFAKSLGGIRDALMAGDWELAGRIAMAGLRLALLQGLDEIRKMFPQTFENVLRGIGRIGDGIVWLWQKVTTFLKNQWNAWGKHVLKTVLDVTTKFAQTWQKTMTGLANWMLKTSAEGGLIGKLVSKILGVDVADVQAERDRLNREAARMGLVEQEDVLGETRKAVEDYMRGLQSDLKAPGVTPGIGKVSQGLEKFLDALKSGKGIEDAASELAALIKEAARRRAEAERPTAIGGPSAAGGPATRATAPIGVALTATYSAKAAQIAGYQPSAGPEKKMVDGITAIERNTKEMTTLQQQFLAGWQIA